MRVERTASMPEEGVVPAFDAGWNAHEVGLERKTVEVLSPSEDSAAWALMGWDCRAKLVEMNRVEG